MGAFSLSHCALSLKRNCFYATVPFGKIKTISLEQLLFLTDVKTNFLSKSRKSAFTIFLGEIEVGGDAF